MKSVLIFLSTLFLSACAVEQSSLVYQHHKEHRCDTLRHKWSVLKGLCVDVEAVSDIKIAETDNHLPVYVILSEDKSQAEIFAADMLEPVVLEVVKGGYVSGNGKIRLLRRGSQWELYDDYDVFRRPKKHTGRLKIFS